MPELKNFSKILANPEDPESQKAMQEYLESKQSAEQLLAAQRKAIDEFRKKG